MTAATLVIFAMTLAPGFAQQAPPRPRPAAPAQANAVDAAKAITLTGCVIPSVEREDTLQLVAAEPERGRPVGTTGTSPAWTVPAYLLLGGTISFAEHANKTVEITGTLETTTESPDPKITSASRTVPPVPAPARLQVQSAKVVAATCTPRQNRQKK